MALRNSPDAVIPRNVKLVKRVRNHANIKTTERYAHALNHEVEAAQEELAQERLAESRKKSRNTLREAG